MKTTDKHCPNCNSLQKFGKQRRKLSDDLYEIFIQCSKCRWSEVITRGNSDTIKAEREIARLRIRAANDPALRRVLQRKFKSHYE